MSRFCLSVRRCSLCTPTYDYRAAKTRNKLRHPRISSVTYTAVCDQFFPQGYCLKLASHLVSCPQSMTDQLQSTYRELEAEKELNDNLVYSILPPSVANRLRMGEPVEAVKYSSVTILFSGVCDFNVFCANNTPMKVVAMLNALYTRFDALADPRTYNVYKVNRSLKLRAWSCFIIYCFTVE